MGAGRFLCKAVHYLVSANRSVTFRNDFQNLPPLGREANFLTPTDVLGMSQDRGHAMVVIMIRLRKCRNVSQRSTLQPRQPKCRADASKQIVDML